MCCWTARTFQSWRCGSAAQPGSVTWGTGWTQTSASCDVEGAVQPPARRPRALLPSHMCKCTLWKLAHAPLWAVMPAGSRCQPEARLNTDESHPNCTVACAVCTTAWVAIQLHGVLVSTHTLLFPHKPSGQTAAQEACHDTHRSGPPWTLDFRSERGRMLTVASCTAHLHCNACFALVHPSWTQSLHPPMRMSNL